MLSAKTQRIITSAAREYDVEAIWLFGSSLGDEDAARDIDLAVEGIAPSKFLKFYSKLSLAIDKPIDLVDLSQEPPISFIIRDEGVRIYER